MKIYLIAALFLGALVVAHSFEEDEKVELPEVPEQEEQSDEEVNTLPGTEEDTQESRDEEVEDEQQDPEKRAFPKNVLSYYSCFQIKRRGYCGHLFLRNLCAATCYRFHPNDPCRKYAVLNQLNRRQSRPRGNARPICDQKGFATRWYRFTGLAGRGMPTSAPPKNRCGTHAPGWMVGRYPAFGQTVTRKVCYHWGKNRCQWNNFIKVKNCVGYYVFYLRPTPVCHLRYCGNA
ncbi:oncoprotein-induced transcript 3 protein-like [Actinia tenebrosa]|uniref:Oncoprotein-induced transcript 3 protein-like n=1 Tax=Actinia tenebrosa TaxID=6105 RepID=A0A6P8H6D7_ACTTE|nr:oncoprotein-induced transcript 3 protein-like [Actinia tenebrosa]